MTHPAENNTFSKSAAGCIISVENKEVSLLIIQPNVEKEKVVMKTSLETIQTLSKVGKILCKIVFVCSLVGAIGCFAGIIALALGIVGAVQLGHVTIHSILSESAGMTLGTLYAAMAEGCILCIGEAVLAKIAENYFRRELAAGTPFTTEGAAELKRLGLWTILLPLGAILIANIMHVIFSIFFQDIADIQTYDFSSIGLGIGFLVLSQLCKHGAEAASSKTPEAGL